MNRPWPKLFNHKHLLNYSLPEIELNCTYNHKHLLNYSLVTSFQDISQINDILYCSKTVKGCIVPLTL